MQQRETAEGFDALERQLEREAKQLIARRSAHLAARVMQALDSQTAAPLPRRQFGSVPWLGLLAAAVMACFFFLRPREDRAHPALGAPRIQLSASGAPASSRLTDPLRSLVTLPAAIGPAKSSSAAPSGLLEREAQLLIGDVTKLASNVIAGLPLAGLPAAWQEKLERL